jgi:hypothetical protein
VPTRPPPAEAVLLTGGLATGKTTVAIEVGEALERARAPFAVIDLDWLCWAWSPDLDDSGVHALLCDNLQTVVPNMMARGVRYFVLARAVLTAPGIDHIRHAVSPMPLRLLRLTANDDEVVRRLRARDSGARLDGHVSMRSEFAQQTRAAAPSADEVDTTYDDAAAAAAKVLQVLGWPSAAEDRADQ